MNFDYEVIDIPEGKLNASEWKYVESEWVSINAFGYCYEYNRVTKETRPVQD